MIASHNVSKTSDSQSIHRDKFYLISKNSVVCEYGRYPPAPSYFETFLVSLSLQDVSIFREGFPASDAVKIMAEDGDNSALVVRAAAHFTVRCCKIKFLASV